MAKFIGFHSLLLPWTIIGWLREKGATHAAAPKGTAKSEEA